MTCTYQRHLRRILLRLLLVLACLLASTLVWTQMAQAQGPEGGTPPAEATLEADAFLSGSSVVVDKNVNGDVLALGQSVTINSDVSGSLFIVADQASLRGKVHGSVYALATSMNLDATSVVERSAYLGAISLITTKGASIARDLYLIAVGAQLRGSVGGATQAIIGPTEIIRLVMTGIESLQPSSPSAQPASGLPGAITIPTEGAQAIDCTDPIASARSVRLTTARLAIKCVGPALPAFTQPAPDPLQNAGTWALNRLRDFILLGVIGLILLFALPRQFHQWSEAVTAKPVLSAGVGLLIAINGVLLIVVLAAGIALVGFALNVTGFASLSLLIWGLGFAVVATAFWLFVLFLLYISQILVAYRGSSSVLSRVAPDTIRHPIIPLAIGLIILVVLLSIPVLGPIIGILSALVGAGAIALSWRDRWSSRRADEAIVPARA